MSNSIWHKKHVFVVDKNGQVIVKLDDGTYDIVWVKKDKALQDVVVFNEIGIKFIEEACYIDDLIAQADKAERLLEIAERQNDILQDHFAMLGYNIGKEVMDMCDEIKQLIKGE